MSRTVSDSPGLSKPPRCSHQPPLALPRRQRVVQPIGKVGNRTGNEKRLRCASNEANYARHIFDRRDAEGGLGATASIVIPWFADRYAAGADWRALAWWIHDHLPYSELQFFPTLAAFNISWHERPKRQIYSYINPKGWLTKPGMANHTEDHRAWYAGFPALIVPAHSPPASPPEPTACSSESAP